MRGFLIVAIVLFGLSGSLLAQKGAAPASRYYRLICLVHLTGSGKAGDPILPEYVAQGTAVAKAAIEATNAANAAAAAAAQAAGGSKSTPTANGVAVPTPPTTTQTPNPVAVTPPTTAALRPGILAWSMQKSDDGKMAILHLVAADHHAFDAILADKRSEVRVFEIGKDSKDSIEKELKKFRKDFDLTSFQVVAQ